MVRIWNTQTGELTQTLTSHADWVRSLSFNPDQLLAGFGRRRPSLGALEKLGQSQPVRVLSERGSPIYSAIFSHDGRRLAPVGSKKR